MKLLEHTFEDLGLEFAWIEASFPKLEESSTFIEM
jgi:hypothetical protein